MSQFSPELRARIGLPSKADHDTRWQILDESADKKVDEALPFLAGTPKSVRSLAAGQHRPWRLYRRLVSPESAARNDRSIIFPGQIHSVFTPLVAEMQALWSVAFLLGRLPVPSLSLMEEEVAVWNSWTKKRYLEQGHKHAYSIYDYLAVSNISFPLQHNGRRNVNIKFLF